MKEEDFDLIEASLRGQLSATEQLALLERVKTDAAFRLDYEEMKLMIIAARELAREKMVDEVKARGPGKVVQWPAARILAIAASLLLIAVVGIWLYPGDSDLFSEYYSPYVLTIDTPRGNAENYESKLRALDLYRNNEATAAIQVVDSVLARDPEDEEAILIKGLSYLSLREFPLALEWLKKIKSISDAVKWYTALAHIGASNKREATALLDQLIESKSVDYAAKASKLRRKLVGD